MTFKPEFEVYGEEGKWYDNGETYATKEEAEESAYMRFLAWTMVKNYRVAEVSEEEHPVTYKMVDGKRVGIGSL